MNSDMKSDTNDIAPRPVNKRRRPRGGSDQFHRIYDPDELERAIRQLAGDRAATEFAVADEMVESSEDRNRLRCLKRIAADPRGTSRRSIICSTEVVRRLSDLLKVMPHFAPVIGVVARAALVSARTQTPLDLPPCLLLGEPGIGKTFALRRIAEALGADFTLIAMNMTDAFRLRGLNTAWRGARMGRIAEVLQSSGSSPVVLLDEFDKIPAVDRAERPYDVWHSLLDRENARHFRDDFLEIEIRADRITWFASANDVSKMPPSILDRLIVLDIPKPSERQLQLVVAGLYAVCRESYGGLLPEDLADDALQELARHSLRHIAQLLRLAIGFAASEGRLRVKVEDIRSANTLAAQAHKRRQSIGFIHSSKALSK
ncbi:hypothetical protein RHAL1_00251 [Beijerinckiaceae bacterium RH AL1]|nr:hypothetical protein RHAL8_00248 [Beijerinckiaceae bacterium RH AL8]VVB42560.1 hypothetical protein RHCH11_RHCH11_00248 [Beijerinckiaceae bacterium RH CH11]VVC53370.1 hypothetical protein RHAL1_00251 [Beijerinckiaceae bacterium RH AL1]